MDPFSNFAASALDKACRRICETHPGGRNDCLNREAYSIGGIVGARLLDFTQAFDRLVAAGIKSGLPRSEAASTAKGALRAGMKNPRDLCELQRGRIAKIAAANGIGNDGQATSMSDSQTSKYAHRLWHEAKGIDGTIAEIYLTGARGLKGPFSESLRFNPSVYHKETQKALPALLALVTDSPELAVHTTFLKPDGSAKAEVEPDKKLFGKTKGGYISLGRMARHMLVAEGIEKAQACQEATGSNVISAISAPNMKNIEWPTVVEKITICGDHGEAGERAVVKAATAWFAQGKKVFVAYPPEGLDWDECDPEVRLELVAEADVFEPEKADKVDQRPNGLAYRKAADVPMRPYSWLWPQKIARGKLTIIAGLPGISKTTATLGLLATVTKGGEFPDSTRFSRPANVIVVSAEDDAEDTLVPRLNAAGADLERVFFLEAVEKKGSGRRAFNLKGDLGCLEDMIEEIGDVAAIMFDPISAYLGDINSHRDTEIRALLMPVADMAANHDVAIIGITHFNKGNGVSKALLRVLGSIAMVAAARAAYAVVEDKDDPLWRLFLSLKNNIGTNKDGFKYRVENVDLGDGIETSKVVWDPTPVEISADEALADEPPGTRANKTEIDNFVTSELRDGPVPALEMFERGEALGFTKKQLNTAKRRLGVQSQKKDMDGGWYWSLQKGSTAENTPEASQGSQKNNWESSGTFGLKGNLRGGENGLSNNPYWRAKHGV